MIGSNGAIRATAGAPTSGDYNHRTLTSDENGHLYAVYANTNPPAGFSAFRSADAGATWANLAAPAINIALNSIQCCYMPLSNKVVMAALGPSGGNIYFWLYNLSTAAWEFAGLPVPTGMASIDSMSIDAMGGRVHLALAGKAASGDTYRVMVYKQWYPFQWAAGAFYVSGNISDAPVGTAHAGAPIATPLILIAPTRNTAYAFWRFTNNDDVYVASSTSPTTNTYDFTTWTFALLGSFPGPLSGVLDAAERPQIMFGQGAFSGYDGSAWSSPIIVTTPAPIASSLSIDAATNNQTVIYTIAATGELAMRTRSAAAGAWSSETILQAGFAGYPSALPAPIGLNTPYIYTTSATAPAGVAYGVVRINLGPFAPSPGPRANFAANRAATFSWLFTDPNTGDTQSAYQLLVIRASDNVTIHDSGKVTSTLNAASVPADTLVNGTAYLWQVRVWDEADVVSSYADLSPFSTLAVPTAAITLPSTNGDTVTTGRLTVTWTYASGYSSAQSAYRLQLFSVSGNVLIGDTGKVSSSVTRSLKLTAALVTATNYRVEVTVWDTNGLASTTAARLFTTAFLLPMTPTISAVTFVGANGGIAQIAYANPTPAGGAPAIAYNELYRARNPAGPWTRLATNLLSGAAGYDASFPLDTTIYYHKIRAVGTNDAIADSAVASGQKQGDGLYLHAVSAPLTSGVRLTLNTGPNDDAWEQVGTTMQFAGRVHPVMEFGESETRMLRYPVTLLNNTTEQAALRALIALRDVIAIRTVRVGAGELFYGAIRGLSVKKDFAFDEGTLEFTQVDYAEGV